MIKLYDISKIMLKSVHIFHFVFSAKYLPHCCYFALQSCKFITNTERFRPSESPDKDLSQTFFS